MLDAARTNVNWSIKFPGSKLLFRFCWLWVVFGSVPSCEVTLSFVWQGNSSYIQICCLIRIISLFLFSSWLFWVHDMNIYCSEITILINELNAPKMKWFSRAKHSSSMLQKLTPQDNWSRFILKFAGVHQHASTALLVVHDEERERSHLNSQEWTIITIFVYT